MLSRRCHPPLPIQTRRWNDWTFYSSGRVVTTWDWMDVRATRAAPEGGRSDRQKGTPRVNRLVESLYRKALTGDVGACCFWLKNRRPSEWRDVQHLDQAVGHYIISDRPMTEDECIAARAEYAQPVRQNVVTALPSTSADPDKTLE